jgi:hypothetical protein
MTTSNQVLFNPAISDLVLESFARIQVKGTSLTAEHTFQAHMSANLLLAEWNVKSGPNLWKIVLRSLPLQQGVASYSLSADTISILDYYIRLFAVGTPVNYAPALSTIINSTSVQVALVNHGLSVGEWVQFVVPISVGGTVIQGFTQVATLVDANTFTVIAPLPATATITAGGAVPSFATVSGSTAITVTLAGHGLGIGSNFNIQVPTTVGGVLLSGSYVVTGVTSTSRFTITGGNVATTTTTASENGGLSKFASQLPTIDPIDRVILPISRSEYSQQPDKFLQAFPTSIWFDRLTVPTVTLWPVPDQNGPYTLFYYALVQIQDAFLANGQTVDMPVRFLEAFASELAARLAVKFNPAVAAERRLDAERAWELAAHQDVEEVPLYIVPGFSGYFR